ncbi:LPXTG cell wall anchor domain-containing protein [Polymorphospora sp. NPDC050346]|uniref:DUF7927 domain-containing protein n=1 Tax=Polymorphospora sp. NPDC050346 TaxID=3155780 RepID=UPI0033FCFD4F
MGKISAVRRVLSATVLAAVVSVPILPVAAAAQPSPPAPILPGLPVIPGLTGDAPADDGPGPIPGTDTGEPARGDGDRPAATTGDAAQVEAARPLVITKAADAAQAMPGAKVNYQIILRSGQGLDDIEVVDDLTGVLDDADYDGNATATAGRLDWAEPELTWTGDVPAGEPVVISYSVTVKTGQPGDLRMRNVVRGPAESNCDPAYRQGGCAVSSFVLEPVARPSTPPPLPNTGAPITWLAAVGGGLLAAGAVALVIARRRRAA